MTKQNLEFKVLQKIVEKLCSQPINWPREIKMARKLIKINANYKFWQSLVPELKTITLSPYMKGQHAFWLEEESKKFNLNDLQINPPKKFALEENKIGPDTDSPKKKKSVLEFVDNVL